MGPGEPPLFPAYPAINAPEEYRFTHRWHSSCNYLQGNEGNIDPVHTSYLHAFKTEEEAISGDKLSGRHGNKGISTRIVPDHEMPHTVNEKGEKEPLQVLLNPSGVPTRINVGQMYETAAGKIAQKTGKAVSAVRKMTIWGNHSATQYPDLFQAEADGKKVWPMINDQAWLESTFIPTVQKRGAAIIEARGLSSAASAANAAIDHVRDWVSGTREGDWISMGIPSDGSYGIPEGVMYGYPVTCKGGKFEIVKGIDVSDFSRGRMQATLKELQEERDAIKHLLG